MVWHEVNALQSNGRHDQIFPEHILRVSESKVFISRIRENGGGIRRSIMRRYLFRVHDFGIRRLRERLKRKER